MVRTISELEANDSKEDLVVSPSKLSEVFRSEGPRHTSVHIRTVGSRSPGLQHSDLQAKRGDRPIIQLRAERPHETDPSVDFE